MPSLAQLTDYDQATGNPVYADPVYLPAINSNDVQLSTGEGVPTRIVVRPEPRPEPMGDGLVAPSPYLNPPENNIVGKLTGANGQERYQLWPEKVLREALSAAGDVMTEGTQLPGLRREDYTDIPGSSQPGDDLVEKAQAMSAVAGSGGLAGTTDATLGATPFLRPALKYKDRIYKGKEGQQHLDVIPPDIYPEFQRQAMSGEDISNFNFGFMNHKGQFLQRDAALDYAIKEGLIDPHAGQYGALTSTLLADSSKPGTAIEAMGKTTQPFYSALEHNVNNISQSKMTGDQWLGTLANKPGVKPEELQWTGLNDFLLENKGKPVTKEAIQEHLQNNKVELKEVNKGELKFNKNSEYALPEVIKAAKEAGDNPGELELVLANDGNAYRALTKKFPHLSDDEDWASKVAHGVFGGDTMPSGTTKFHSYQLPGGENYREMLMTLPVKKSTKIDPSWKTEKIREGQYRVIGDHDGDKNALLGYGKTPEEALQNAAKDTSGEWAKEYKSSHWDEPNILAHVRMNDRNIDGKKSLHLEEIQSDWHQQGRDKGYKGDSKAAATKIQELLKEASTLERSDPRYKEIYSELPALQSKSLSEPATVPDAPFKKTWHELALKRMIREAAEKGYDRLSWTPGEAQAARYDLSKSVDKIAVPMVNKNGTRSVRIDSKSDSPFKLMVDKNGIVDGSHSASQFSGKPLSDVVGKEMADKIMKLEKPNEFSGDGLKIGGEGMKGFYDKMIPQALEKIGKEHGVKVKQGEIGGTSGTYKYSGPEKNIDEVIKLYDSKTLPGTLNSQLSDVLANMGEGVNFSDAMSKHGSKPLAKIFNGELKPIIKGAPIHYIDIPQSLKDHAMHKGFPLFSSGGHLLLPVVGNPYEQKK